MSKAQGAGRDLKSLLSRDKRLLARLLSAVERGGPDIEGLLKQVHKYSQDTYYVGITGGPGVGKSTLVSSLTSLLRREGHSVGILAVDPSSPFTGGALLGDRIRMRRHFADPGVFIRSVATKGVSGGLPTFAGIAVRLMGASGKDIAIVETTGVGQGELAVREVADTVVVVLEPGSGDAIQMMKSGILEVAHILVINKCDKEGAAQLHAALTSMAEPSRKIEDGWAVPIVQCQATTGQGVERLRDAIYEHKRFQESSGPLERRREERYVSEFLRTIEMSLALKLRALLTEHPSIASVLAEVRDGESDPFWAALKCANKLQLRLD